MENNDVRIIHVPLPRRVHDLLIELQRKKGFENQSQALCWVIEKATEEAK